MDAFESSVGRSSTPESLARTFVPGGTGRFPLMARIRAPDSPEMNRSGTCTTLTILRRPDSAAMAASIDRLASSLPATPTMISSASRASATSAAPLRMRYGERIMSILSLTLPGSPSVALTTTIVGLSLASAD